MSQRADLVLEGGGVKGVALVGAVTALAGAGFSFPRVAGSSAGSVVAVLVAALQRAGEPLSRLAEIEAAIDYRRFRDGNALGAGIGLLLHEGLYPGRYLADWVGGVLRDLGVERFGDLRSDDDADTGLPPERRYRVVVTTSDLSTRRLLRLPWDFAELGLDPDEQSVAEAVRASCAIPGYFQPVRRAGRVLVDGGLLSNFPVALFDRADGSRPRWPTFGVKLSARAGARPVTVREADDPLDYALAVLQTLLAAQDAAYVDQPCVQQRTVFVDTGDTSSVDFGITAEQRVTLGARGKAAAVDFLSTWDEAAYLARCR